MLWLEKARAKINLALDVRGKRDDGYHEVEMIMQTVDFCDFLTFSDREDDRIEVRTNALYVPTDERNLAFKAADLLRRYAGYKGGVTIEIDKRIPVAAGLAGGSADAAATLRGLNQKWNLGFHLNELAALGATIGSDVPFCVYGGTAVAHGRGEILEPQPLCPSFWVVLAKPQIAVSTADVYGALRLTDDIRRPSIQRALAAVRQGDLQGLSRATANVLESVTCKEHPELVRLKDQMVKLGGQVVLMSGSGPTIFALLEREQRARRMYTALRTMWKEVYLCQTC
ncbi:MAG: 4-(cytidine 5'-diphospho)-2-C-methyl-D-erythritol kinase [Firmicutes bacterium]|nr:4-(cytidine 5'-diphospho)-2-C-methyl-D-erythritol kinase [Bacillota bacterium]